MRNDEEVRERGGREKTGVPRAGRYGHVVI